MNNINLKDVPLELLIAELQSRGLSPTFLSTKNHDQLPLLQEDKDNLIIQNNQYEKSMLTTLGGKNKPFNFHIQDDNIVIDRLEAGIQDVLPIETLYSVMQKLKTEGNNFPLASNVQFLKLGVEKPGLGSSVYEATGDVKLAQASSQLAAILRGCNVLGWDGLKRAMSFTILHMPSSAFELSQILIVYQKNLSNR
jgi:hypothetical protein